MPNILGSVGVSESKDDKLGVDTDDALDVLGLFLDGVGVDWLVGRVADFALPVEKIGVIVSSYDERVSEGDLVLVWD